MSVILWICPSSSQYIRHPLYVSIILSMLLASSQVSIILSIYPLSSQYVHCPSSSLCLCQPLNDSVILSMYPSSSQCFCLSFNLYVIILNVQVILSIFPLNVSVFLPISLLSFQYVHYFSMFMSSNQYFHYRFNVSVILSMFPLILSVFPSSSQYVRHFHVSVILSKYPSSSQYSHYSFISQITPVKFKLKNAEKVWNNFHVVLTYGEGDFI